MLGRRRNAFEIFNKRTDVVVSEIIQEGKCNEKNEFKRIMALKGISLMRKQSNQYNFELITSRRSRARLTNHES